MEKIKMASKSMSVSGILYMITSSSPVVGMMTDKEGDNFVEKLLNNCLTPDGKFKEVELKLGSNNSPKKRFSVYGIKSTGDRIIIPACEKDKTIEKLTTACNGIEKIVMLGRDILSEDDFEWLLKLCLFAEKIRDHIINSVGYDPNYWLTAR